MFELFRWFLQESNQGHTDFQSVALPTELRNLFIFLVVQMYKLLLNPANFISFFLQYL